MRQKRFLFLSIFLVVSIAFASSAMAIVVTGENSGANLVDEILGTGITISNVTYIGDTNQAGIFTGGESSGLSIDEGIVLTSGDATLIDNDNSSDAATANLGMSGDADLESILPPSSTTYDANILEFDFISAGGSVFFNYQFGSEEYNEYTNTGFNDVFGFFLDDTNIALLPTGADTSEGTQVSVNTVNGGGPIFGTDPTNPDLYNNNDLNDGGPYYTFEYDGFTDLFTASVINLAPGLHNIKLAIADTGDEILDSGVFIQAGSFSDVPVPEPSLMGLLLVSGLVGLAGYGRKKFKKQ